jgi:hypothetical protein
MADEKEGEKKGARQGSGPDPRDRLAAEFALSLVQVDFADGVTLADDEEFLASGTERPLPFMAGDVTDVHIFQP